MTVPYHRITEDEGFQIVELWKAGKSDKEIAERVGFAYGAIFQFRRRMGMKANSTKAENSRKGGAATRERHGPEYYRKIATARWDRVLGRD